MKIVEAGDMEHTTGSRRMVALIRGAWGLCDDVVVLVVEGPEGEDPEGLLLHPVAAYAVVVDGVLLEEPEGLLLVALGDVEEEFPVLPSAGGGL